MPARGAATRKSATPTSEPEEAQPDSGVDFNTPEFRAKPLIEKLAAIMGAVTYIPKRGFNDFHKYRYVMEADLVSTIRPLLSASGIIIIPNVVREKWEADVISERNGTSSLCRVMVEYTVTDGRDSFTFKIPGYGVDRSDKSIYKAMTGSMKYALMKLFEVETGDDPEREAAPHAATRIEESHEEGVERGGRQIKATRYQLQRIIATMREKGMQRVDLLALILDLFGVELELPVDDEAAAQNVILTYLTELDSHDAGQLLTYIDNWKEDDDDDEENA